MYYFEMFNFIRFDAIWDTRDEEFGELRPYQVLYFLADDTIAVKEVHDRNSGRDPFPLLLRKTKLPKVFFKTNFLINFFVNFFIN